MRQALVELRSHFRANPLSWLVAVLLLTLQAVVIYFLYHMDIAMRRDTLIHDQSQHLELVAQRVEQRMQLVLSQLRVLAAENQSAAERGQEAALIERMQQFCRGKTEIVAVQVRADTLVEPLVAACQPLADQLRTPFVSLEGTAPTRFTLYSEPGYVLNQQLLGYQWLLSSPRGDSEWQLTFRALVEGLPVDHGAEAKILLVRNGADWLQLTQHEPFKPARAAWGAIDHARISESEVGLLLFHPLELRDPADQSVLAHWRLVAFVPRAVLDGYWLDFLRDLGILALVFVLVLLALYLYSRRIIGQQVAMLATLRRKQAFLDTLLDSSPDAMLTIDLDGSLVSFNAPTRSLFGYRAGELEQRSVELLLPSDYQMEDQDYQALYVDLANSNATFQRCERIGIRAHGEVFPVEVTYCRLKDVAPAQLLLIVREITERKVAEQELDSLREQYFQQEKMAQIGLLMAGILHEVGNPLAAIEGLLNEVVYLDADRETPQLDPHTLGNIHLVLEQTARIRGICQDVSGFATPRAHGRGPVSLNQILQSAATLLGYDKRWRHIALDLQLDTRLPALDGVADQLTQVFMNLLVNAADAINEVMPEQPEVQVRTKLLATGVIEVQVRDNGAGISEAAMRHIFDNFYTTKPKGKGTGLGLSICEKLVEEHGGTIEIESREGGGTAVRLYFLLNNEQIASGYE